MYRNFEDLPEGLKIKIKSVFGKDPDKYVHKAVPALHGRSIIEQMNLSGGDIEVRIYLQRIESDSY
jgi:hypothetical protein